MGLYDSALLRRMQCQMPAVITVLPIRLDLTMLLVNLLICYLMS